MFYLVKMANNTFILGAVILTLIIGGYFLFAGAENVTGNAVSNVGSDDAQKVNLGIKNYNYYPDVVKVKSGQPVEITLDNSVVGCYRSFTIRDLGISKYSSSPNDKVIFTPTEKGTYTFACSMGMGVGKLIVE